MVLGFEIVKEQPPTVSTSRPQRLPLRWAYLPGGRLGGGGGGGVGSEVGGRGRRDVRE